MIIKGKDLPFSKKGLKLYPLTSHEIAGNHFAVWETRPENPFVPHRHEQRELWFIMEGQATVTVNGEDFLVDPGDLIDLAPWSKHGLRTDGRCLWICMG